MARPGGLDCSGGVGIEVNPGRGPAAGAATGGRPGLRGWRGPLLPAGTPRARQPRARTPSSSMAGGLLGDAGDSQGRPRCQEGDDRAAAVGDRAGGHWFDTLLARYLSQLRARAGLEIEDLALDYLGTTDGYARRRAGAGRSRSGRRRDLRPQGEDPARRACSP